MRLLCGFQESLAVSRWPPCQHRIRTVPSLSGDRKASGALKHRRSGNPVCLYFSARKKGQALNSER